MSDPNDIVLHGLNIEAFERLVYLRDGTPECYEEITRELLTLLGRLRQGSGFFGVAEEVLPILYTRLAGAVTVLFTDPKFTLTPDGFLQIASRHSTLHSIFRASSYETMDHVLASIGTRKPEAPEQMDFAGDIQIMKMLICWSLDSDVEINWPGVAEYAPYHAAAAILGMLSIGGTHSKKSYERRLMLMGMRGVIAKVPMHEWLIQCAGDAYMHCSYTDAPDKHEIKAVVNERMRELIGRTLSLTDITRKARRKERPTVLVPLEWFGSHHAMYRCYAPSLLQLKERFRLVGLHRDSHHEIDEIGKSVFDKTIAIPSDTVAIQTILEAIHVEEPDILYYPSLGMAAWYVALSNFRLAPLQIISPGHPATSRSNCIDAIVSDGDLFGDRAQYSESVLEKLPVGGARYIGRAGVAYPQRAMDGVFRIAVPAMAVKLIPPFLETLRRIRAQASRPVEFHFFPNMVSVSHDIITKDLRRWIPDAVVHPRDSYQGYINRLGRCDLVCSTFPFGGTNSVIDCFLCGVPVVTLEGDQIHSRSDASMIRRMGLGETTIAHSADEYVSIALGMIAGEYAVKMPPSEAVEAEFFGPGPAHVQGAFLKAFEQLWDREVERAEQEDWITR